MKNLILFLGMAAFFLISCTQNNQVIIAYESTGAISQYKLQYLDNSGILQDTIIHPQSKQDAWSYRFVGEQGDIVYVSGKYNDPETGLKIMIKVEGKIYKQASNEGDTLNYLIVSGVVPISD